MRIRREDVEHVREAARIEEVVAEHVTLKAAGVGSLKGLCPFHDERTPSFHVRPQAGLWHCFGCGEGGDVISFLQKVDHLGFTEAVEWLASRQGYELHYEDDGGRGPARRDLVGARQRLVEANRAAAAYYVEQLSGVADAAPARDFLLSRGFDEASWHRFGVGFAPRAGEALLRHLRGRGVTEDELLASGLAGRGQRGLYDRFRGRLLWPIRDLTGDVVGFGARRLFEDDRIEAKYLNTPDTALYKKSLVLYGVDAAKRDIARTRRVVVVEGYTDVMACHLAGVPTAVATCGTAFGEEHIRLVRRLVGDDGTRGTEIIFTFDGDAAGQKAAMRAFQEDQRFVASTFVAVARDGLDPCELRVQRGDQAVRDLVEGRQPLFAFAIRTTLTGYDLDTAEGRVAALRAAAPVVAGIRDRGLRPEYARLLAGWLGMEVEEVRRAVARAGQVPRAGTAPPGPSTVGAPGGRGRPGEPRPDAAAPTPARAPSTLDDPVVRAEREALTCMLQVPFLLPAEDADGLGADAFVVPAHQAVFEAVRAAGGIARAATMAPQAWVEAVREATPATVAGMVTELAVSPLPADGDEGVARYAASLVLRVAELQVTREIATLRSRLQRVDPGDGSLLQVMGAVNEAEGRRRALRERMTEG